VSDEQATPKKRSHKMYVLWAIALTLLISAALFCWLAVVPVWRTHRVLADCNAAGGWIISSGSPRPPAWVPSQDPEEAVASLGGSGTATARLRFYLRMPRWIATRRFEAAVLLGHCGESAVPVLIPLLRDRDLSIREVAAGNLAAIGKPVDRVVSVLAEALDREAGENSYMTIALCESLGTLGSRAKAAIPALERAARADYDAADPRQAATEALKKIKAAQEKPKVDPQTTGAYIKALDKPVSVEFRDVPAEELITFFRGISGVNIISTGMDKLDLEQQITLERKSVPIAAILEVWCARVGADWTVAPSGTGPDSVVTLFISTRERIAEMEKADPVTAKRFRAYRKKLTQYLPAEALKKIKAAQEKR
jgi:HEAT repeats